MKRLKRSISTFLVGAVLLSATSFSAGISAAGNTDINIIEASAKENTQIFNDIAPDSDLYECTKALYENGIMPGYDDGCFHPEKPVMYQTIAYFMYNLLRQTTPENFDIISEISLIPPDSVYYNAMAWMLNEGIIVSPSNYIDQYTYFEVRLRCEVLTILKRTIDKYGITLNEVSNPDEFSDVADKNSWYYDVVELFRKAGLIRADENGEFRPSDTMTNGELAKILYGMLDMIELKPLSSMPAAMPVETPIYCEHTNVNFHERVEPTCTEKGYTVRKCSLCGETFNVDYTDALGHDFTDLWIPVAVPTVESSGMRVKPCSRCDEVIIEGCPALTDSASSFSDIGQEWYKPYIDYVFTRGVMLGTSNNSFSPHASMSRAMLVTVLWRIEGEPKAKAASPFSDIPSEEWYSEAVAWAAENGIVNGVSPTSFNPNAEITRQDMVTILCRYAGEYKKSDVSQNINLYEIIDSDKVSDYARYAMSWAVAMGIINGKDGLLAPLDTATRAEFSAMFMRFDLQY